MCRVRMPDVIHDLGIREVGCGVFGIAILDEAF